MNFLKKNGKKMGLALLSTVMFFLCSGLLYVTKLANSMPQLSKEDGAQEIMLQEENPNLQAITKEKMENYWNIAVFGVDSRDGETLGKGTHSDTQILCVIEKNSGAIKLVSVYRDTFLQLDENTDSYGKINASYMSGGPVNNVKALNRNLDLNITDYISFNWKAAAEVIDLLGGVDIEITPAEWEYINAFITETVNVTGIASSHLESDGKNHLDGVQALAYCRLRLMDSDIERTRRQQNVIRQVFEKARTADVTLWSQLLGVVLPQTATSISYNDMLAMAKDIGRYYIDDTAGFPASGAGAHMGEAGNCLIPNTLELNVESLHRFLYGAEDYRCSDTVKKIDREILKRALKN